MAQDRARGERERIDAVETDVRGVSRVSDDGVRIVTVSSTAHHHRANGRQHPRGHHQNLLALAHAPRLDFSAHRRRSERATSPGDDVGHGHSQRKRRASIHGR